MIDLRGFNFFVARYHVFKDCDGSGGRCSGSVVRGRHDENGTALDT